MLKKILGIGASITGVILVICGVTKMKKDKQLTCETNEYFEE